MCNSAQVRYHFVQWSNRDLYKRIVRTQTPVDFDGWEVYRGRRNVVTPEFHRYIYLFVL